MKERTKIVLLVWTLCCLGMIAITYNPDIIKDLTFEGVKVTHPRTNRYMKEAAAVIASWEKTDSGSERINDVAQEAMVTPESTTIPGSIEQQIQAPTEVSNHKNESNLLGNICHRMTRLQLLRHTCDVMGLTDEEIVWKRMIGYMWIVDHIHKILYCMIPKTATHSLRYLLASASIGDRLDINMMYPIHSYLNTTGFRFLHKLREDERDEVLRDYFKMLVVRHPMDRLRSAYENKLKEPGGLNYQLLNRNVPFIETYFQTKGVLNETDTFDPMTDALTFQQFLELVSIDPDEFYDEHWRSAYKTCRPCTIKYDAVMRVETLDNDIKVLYDHLESQGHPNPGVAHENAEVDNSPEQKLVMASEAFDKITPVTVSGIMKVYEKDFKLFGYHWDKKTGATCGIEDESGSSCC